MRVSAGNVPRAGWSDVFRAWSSVRKQLPAGWCTDTDDEWKRRVFSCTQKPWARKGEWQKYRVMREEVPTTKEVYTLRKELKGMVIGPLDKNKGELWVMCPTLYHRALRKAYSVATGYQPIFPAKLSQYRKKRYTTEELPRQIMRDERMQDPRQRGSEKDIINLWARIAKSKGWDKYAKCDTSGGAINQPYILLKAKNVTDPKKRQLSWMKVRPIAPATKHPLKRLLHYVGRAWSFISTQLTGEHFVISKTTEVPGFMREATAKVGPRGRIQTRMYDIEGCYPNMPKESIRFAMMKAVRQLSDEFGYNGVFVPKWSDTQPCSWRTNKMKTSQKIPFEVMLDVMNFSLNNAMTKMPSGQLMRQVAGVPMGDPISPGMTVATCAWMEDEWLQTIATEDCKYFAAARFMDDIMLVYAKTAEWDGERFEADFAESQCYQEPLKLEAGKEGTFLETRYIGWRMARSSTASRTIMRVGARIRMCGAISTSTRIRRFYRSAQHLPRVCGKYKRWRATRRRCTRQRSTK